MAQVLNFHGVSAQVVGFQLTDEKKNVNTKMAKLVIPSGTALQYFEVETWIDEPHLEPFYAYNHHGSNGEGERGAFIFAVGVKLGDQQGVGDVYRGVYTREKGKDNVDVINIDAQGVFGDIQVAILTREDGFYLSMQQIFNGQHVTTSKDGRPGTSVSKYIPIDPLNAYAGFKYDNTWVQMAEALQVFARAHEASRHLSRVRHKHASWVENYPPAREGLKQGQVLYYNPIVEFGVVQDRNGERYIVFRNQLSCDEIRFAAGEPIYFLPGQRRKGHNLTPVDVVMVAA